MTTPARPSAATPKTSSFQAGTLYFWVYLALYREVTAPAPGNSRQTAIFNPTPISLFVPQIEIGVGFSCGFWNIWGGGGGE